MATQIQAQKIANDIFKKEKPYAVIYGYSIQRGINANVVKEYLDSPIVCETKEKFEELTMKYLSKSSATRKVPTRIVGFEVLYSVFDESFGQRTIRKSFKIKI